MKTHNKICLRLQRRIKKDIFLYKKKWPKVCEICGGSGMAFYHGVEKPCKACAGKCPRCGELLVGEVCYSCRWTPGTRCTWPGRFLCFCNLGESNEL